MDQAATSDALIFRPQPQASREKTYPGQQSDADYEDEMPRRSTGELNEELDTVSLAQLIVRSQERSDERFAQVIERLGNGKKTWPTWIASGVAVAALLINVSGSRWAPAGESALTQQLALQQQSITTLNQMLSEAREEIKTINAYNDNTRVQFASHGWSINPKTGEITKVR